MLLFLISVFSGVLVFLKKRAISKVTGQLLSFSGAYLLSICFLHLLPELFEVHYERVGLFLLIGFFLQLVLDYFSGGIEHGHAHVNKKRLGKFPWLVFLSLCLHAFLEAIPLQQLVRESSSSSYLLGLMIHKAPISFVLTALLIGYQLKKEITLFSLIIFSLMGPLGALFGSLVELTPAVFSQFLALSVGIILHLSTTILLETNEAHEIQWRKLLPMLLGIALALLSLGHS